MAARKGAAKAVETGLKEVISDFEADVKRVSALEHRVEKLVHSWRAEHLTNNAFSQDTGAWNVLHEKLPHLVRAIVEEIG